MSIGVAMLYDQGNPALMIETLLFWRVPKWENIWYYISRSMKDVRIDMV